MRARLGKVIGAGVMAVFAVAVLVSGFAPQLPALLREGFPSAVWPSNGQVLLVKGVDGTDPEHAGALPAASLDRFAQSAGRAILVAGPEGLITEHLRRGLSVTRG